MAGIADVVTVQTALDDDPFEPSPTWLDQHEIVVGASTLAGIGSTFDRYRASSLTVEFDNTVDSIDMLQWYRWRQVRMVSVADDVVLAHGHIDTPSYDIGSQSPFRIPGVLPCLDGVGLFARRELDEEPIPAGSTTEVITYLTGLAGLPTPTFVGMSSVPIARRAEASGNVLEILQDVLDTECGVMVRQPQDAPLQLEVRGRYAPLVAMQDYLDNGPKCVLRGDPTVGATPPEAAVRRGSIPLRSTAESFRDQVTGKSSRGRAFSMTDPAASATFPRASLSREFWTANDRWVESTVDMLLKIHLQRVGMPEKFSVLCATATGPLPELAVVQALRFGDLVNLITPATGAAPFTGVVQSVAWKLTRQELSAEIGLGFPHMAAIYGGIDEYAHAGTAVVGTSKVLP